MLDATTSSFIQRKNFWNFVRTWQVFTSYNNFIKIFKSYKLQHEIKLQNLKTTQINMYKGISKAHKPQFWFFKKNLHATTIFEGRKNRQFL